MEQLIKLVAAHRGVQRLVSGAVQARTFAKDTFLLRVVRDVLNGGRVQRACVVNDHNMDESGQHWNTVVYSVDAPVPRAPVPGLEEGVPQRPLSARSAGFTSIDC